MSRPAESAAPQREWEDREWFPPGPQLAICLSGGKQHLTDLTDAELLQVAAAARRQASWAQARELAAIAELAERRTRAEADGDPDYRTLPARESVADELAAALTVTGNTAATLVHLAERLAGPLSDTGAALETGHLDFAKARVISDLTDQLSEPLARRVQAAALPKAPAQTTGQLRRAIKRILHRLAPEAIEERKREAIQQRRLEIWDTPSGTTDLGLCDLPTEDAHAIFNKITAAAHGIRHDGDSRPLNMIRADLATQLLHGHPLPDSISNLLTTANEPAPPAALTPVHTDDVQHAPEHELTSPVPAPEGHHLDATDQRASALQPTPRPDSSLPGSLGVPPLHPARQGPGVAPEGQVAGQPTVRVATQASGTTHPACQGLTVAVEDRSGGQPAGQGAVESSGVGSGAVHPHPARQGSAVVTQGQAGGHPTVRGAVETGGVDNGAVHPHPARQELAVVTQGQAGGHPTVRGAVEGSGAACAAHPPSGHPGTTRSRPVTDQATRLPDERSGNSGLGSDTGPRACPGDAVEARHLGLVVAPKLHVGGYLTAPGIVADTGGTGDDFRWAADLAGRRLAHLSARTASRDLAIAVPRAVRRIYRELAQAREAACRGGDQTHGRPGYRPPTTLRREIEERHSTCVFPTCNQPSHRCDLDHTVPWHPGSTCRCNLAPLCRRHHRLKQSPGWTLHQIWPGLLIWTTPSGTWYIVRPDLK